MKKILTFAIALTVFVSGFCLPCYCDTAYYTNISNDYVTNIFSPDDNDIYLYVPDSNDGRWSYYLNKNTDEIALRYRKFELENGVFNIPEQIDGKDVTGLIFGFDGISLKESKKKYKMVIPKTVKEIDIETYEGAEYKVSEYIVDPENEYFTSKDGVLYTKDMRVMFAYPDKSPRKKYVMPNSVTKGIAYLKFADNLETLVLSDNLTGITNAFAGCKNLKTVKMGNKIKFISEHAFQNNKKLKNVNMPKKLKEIWRMAFFGCRKIKKLTFSKNIKAIDEEAFGNCKSLSKVTFNGKKKAPKIGIDAFKGTKKGIKFYVKNKKVAKSLKKQLKNSGAKSARIIIK